MTMPANLPAPTGSVQYLAGGVYRADGTTRLTATTAASLFTTPASTDPPLLVPEDVYQDRIPDGTVYPAHERVLLFRQGQIIKTSAMNAAFPKAAVTSIAPATGAHGSTTPGVVITGSGFTPATTLTVGGTPATAVVVTSPTLLTCTVPTASAAGAANVVLTNDGGATTVTGGFTYS